MVDAGTAAQSRDPAGEHLARRNGRLYLIGLAASLIGNSAMSLVAGIWVKSLIGSSTEAGLVSVCVYAPSLAGPLAGMLADRVRRRRFLLGLNALSAVMLLPLLAVSGRGEVWIVFAVMTWYGIDLTLPGPAENGLFVARLPAEARQRLNGWNLGLQETGRLVAPLLGAGLFLVLGGGAVALVDAATFVLAALMIWRIRLEEAKLTRQQTHWRADVPLGARVSHRALPSRRPAR
jgi:MFS family permease